VITRIKRKPAELVRVSGLNLLKCFLISGAHPRRHAIRVMVMMAVMETRWHEKSRLWAPPSAVNEFQGGAEPIFQ
jgi:hypothetical protein